MTVKSWQDEMTSLEAQLMSSVKFQLENTRKGVESLSSGQDRLRDSSASLKRVNELCQQSENLIENYPFIKQVSLTHRNFAMTKKVYLEFCALDQKVNRCCELINEDIASGNPENLLLVYHYLSKLENFRIRTLELMKDAPSTSLYTLKRYFKKLDDLSHQFETFFWKLPRRLFEFRDSGHLIVAIALVITKMDPSERAKFNTIIDDMINVKFNEALQESKALIVQTDPNGKQFSTIDISVALSAIGFWKEDLMIVKDDFSDKFPEQFSIFDFFMLTMHRNIHSLVSKSIPSNPASMSISDILTLLSWIKSYYQQLVEDFGVTHEEIEPRLLDPKQESLIIKTYAVQSKNQIADWIGRLSDGEIERFLERSALPETDADDRYMTAAAIDLFQIVKQHLQTASEASNGRLLIDLINACVEGCESFQHSFSKSIQSETKRAMNPKTEFANHFEDYLIMIGNTGLKWVSWIEDLVEDCQEKLSAEYADTGISSLRRLGDGWVSLAKSCTGSLVDLIFVTVQPVFAQLFTSAWYDGENIVANIVATFDDYFNDYSKHTDEFLMSRLVADVLERFILSFIRQLKHKHSKLIMPRAKTLLTKNVESVIALFSEYREPARVARAVEPLSAFVSFISASPRMLFLEFVGFYKGFPDISPDLIDQVLRGRDDLEKSELKTLMGDINKKIADEAVGLSTDSTLFSKV